MTEYSHWSARLQVSDRQAFAEVFEALHQPLLRYAVRLTKDEDVAYDMVQDAFIKLWTIRSELDPEKSLRALMFTIVRNRSLNHLRQVHSRHATVTDMPPHESFTRHEADQRLDAEALGKRIREWIAELPPRRREAFQLSRFDGLSHREISEVMDVAPRTVTNHVMLALQHLRDRLRAYEADGAQ